MKSFKKTVIDGLFEFIIVDAINSSLAYCNELYNFGKHHGFTVRYQMICGLQFVDIFICRRAAIYMRTAAAHRHLLCPKHTSAYVDRHRTNRTRLASHSRIVFAPQRERVSEYNHRQELTLNILKLNEIKTKTISKLKKKTKSLLSSYRF